MKPNLYQEAIAKTSIPHLTKFVKANDITITGWAKLKSDDKREALMNVLKASSDHRVSFVAFFAETNPDAGYSASWADWENDESIADAEAAAETEAEPEADTEADTPEPETLPATADASPAITQPTTPAFVEGAFANMIADASGLDAKASTSALRAVEEDIEFHHMRIGALLSHVQSAQHYVTMGYDNMREYLAGETSIEYRKGMYLIQNVRVVQEIGLTDSDLKGVSWSALRHIQPVLAPKGGKVLDRKAAKKWLDAARSMTQIKLKEAVAAQKQKDSGALPAPKDGEPDAVPAPQVSSKSFNLAPDQAETLEQALQKAKVEGNTDSQAAALDVLASAYLGSPPANSTLDAVMPDLSDDGLNKMFTAIRNAEGYDGVKRILNVIDAVFPEVDITAAIPS